MNIPVGKLVARGGYTPTDGDGIENLPSLSYKIHSILSIGICNI